MLEPNTTIRLTMGIPEPGLDNNVEVDISIELSDVIDPDSPLDSYTVTMTVEELMRLLTMAATTGWGSAFHFLQTVTERWRGNAVAQNEELPGVHLDLKLHAHPPEDAG